MKSKVDKRTGDDVREDVYDFTKGNHKKKKILKDERRANGDKRKENADGWKNDDRRKFFVNLMRNNKMPKDDKEVNDDIHLIAVDEMK